VSQQLTTFCAVFAQTECHLLGIKHRWQSWNKLCHTQG